MKTLSFKYKLIISILSVSLFPLTVSLIYSLKTSKDEIERQSTEKLVAIRDAQNQRISSYLFSVTSQVITLGHDQGLLNASKDFITSFKNLPKPTPEMKKHLSEYYKNQYGNEYKKITGELSPLDNVVNDLPDSALVLQNAFIASNSNPLGSKHLLVDSPLVPEYSEAHKKYHPYLKEYLEQYSLYDIFIVNIETGDVVYTVFKEIDFSTNLLTGPYKDSDLAQVFKEASKLNDKKEFSISDFKRYAPSYEAPASFMGIPVWEGNKKVAVLIFQMPLGAIKNIMSERSGLGKTGEMFVVGEDKKLRSDLHNDQQYNIYNSFNKGLLINSPNIKQALSDHPGHVIDTNYAGKKVLSTFTKLNFPHYKWVVFAEQETGEAFSGVEALQNKMILFIALTIVGVLVVTLLVTRKLSSQIANVVEVFSSSAHDVQNSSQRMDLISNRLNGSVQTQISSITQTAAAMEEITATLKNNSKSTENAAKLSKDSKSSAMKGKETVARMLEEVTEISKSYEEIKLSLEKNNQDTERIVKVIDDIAKKTEVINEIVFQTKLLSFNASVEAARAGESGKGFAVVAEEIANLAAMSGKASADIKNMLIESQDQVKAISSITRDRIVSIVNQGQGKVANGNEVASLCIEQLDQILLSIESLDSSIVEINSAIGEQSMGIEEVNSVMKQLESATHDTTDMSEKSKLSAEDLKNQSHALRASIQELRQIMGVQKGKT